VPVVFDRGTLEVFEFPKSELLAAGTVLLLGGLLRRELSRARFEGTGAWLRGLPGRALEGARRDPLGGAVGLFLVSAFLSALFAARHDAAFFGAHESEAGLKTALATAGLYFASRSLALDPRHLDRLTRAAGMALLLALLYGFLQMVGLDPFPWTRSATIGAVRRVPGTLGHANHLGAFIAMMLPLVGRMAALARSRRARLFWIALGVLSLPVLAATLSRGAWVAAAAGLLAGAVLALRARSRGAGGHGRRVARTLGLTALLLAAFLVPLVTPLRSELLMRFRQITDVHAPSTQSRVHLWRAGIEMAARHPLLGVGTDGYLGAFPRYRTPEYWNIEWNGVSAKAHDELIQIAATQGLPGLLAAILVIALAARAILILTRRRESAALDAAAAGGALTAFAVQGLVGFTVVSTGILAAALAGWAAGSASADRAPDLAPSPIDRGARNAAWALAVLLGAVLVILPWLAEITATPALRDPMTPAERADRLGRAASLAPWDARYPTELGRTLLGAAFTDPDPRDRLEDLARARAAFERAASLAPEDGELQALVARAKASQAAANPRAVPASEIQAAFDRAIALEPRNANVLELAAQGYLEMGRTADARAVALRCARLFPDFALPMSDLGVAALLEGRAKAAADTLTLALRRNWHGEEAAAMAAKSNYVAALREMRLGDVLKGDASEPRPTRPSPPR